MESLGFKRSALVEGLQDPSGLTYGTVRHNLKDQPQFADAIKRWLSDRALLMERYPGTYKNVKSDDPAAMAAADRKASQQAMLDLEKVLPLKDATNWTERWYFERYGTEVKDPTTQTVSKVETHVKFDKGAAKDAGIDLTDTRVGDAVDTPRRRRSRANQRWRRTPCRRSRATRGSCLRTTRRSGTTSRS